MPQTTVNVAMIGCGNLGRVHAECLSKIPRARILAYCDIAAEPAEKLLAAHGGEYATRDSDKVFADKRIDAVYISTRHDAHAPLAIAAAKAGKHVMIEKPLALTLDECRAIERAVTAAGVHLMPAFKMRYYPTVRMAKELIPTPHVQYGRIIKQRWADNRWDMPPEQGGGNVLGQGCHTIDLVRYLAGSDVVSVHAVGGNFTHPDHPFPDQCMSTVRFANGTGAVWVQGDAGPARMTGDFYWELFGDGNKSAQIWDRLKKATYFDNGKTWTEERPDEEGFQLESEAFIGALAEGRAPMTTLHDGIEATRIPLAAIESIRTGKVVHLREEAVAV
jgi:predicted dehydrogenase